MTVKQLDDLSLGFDSRSVTLRIDGQSFIFTGNSAKEFYEYFGTAVHAMNMKAMERETVELGNANAIERLEKLADIGVHIKNNDIGNPVIKLDSGEELCAHDIKGAILHIQEEEPDAQEKNQ